MTPNSRSDGRALDARLPLSPTELAVGLGILALLTLTSTYSYLVFHTLAEIFSVVIASGVFVIAWSSHRFRDINYLLFLGIGLLAVAAVDLVHALAYKGVGVFAGISIDVPTQLWIAGRFLEAATLLGAPLTRGRRLSPGALFAAFSAAAAIFGIAIFTGAFPSAFTAETGLTPFKIISEYVVCAIFGAALWLLYRAQTDLDPAVKRLIATAIALRIASELAFTLYDDPYAAANTAGHLLKIAAYYLFYKAIIQRAIYEPHAILFRDLQRNEAELRHTISELEAFSLGVAHDLRSPIATIRGFAQLLAEDPSLSPEARERLGDIVAGANRMNEIIADMLALGRLERSELREETVDLGALARSAFESLRQRTDCRRVDFVAPERLPIKADPGLARVAVENLISNALKFTSKQESPRIEIGSRRDGDTETFYVRDNGAGFDPARVSRLFSPFGRLHDQSEFAGTGIGLMTVRRIVERHGGTIRAESAPGEGATFYFTFGAEKDVVRKSRP
ncbi:MAG TPA: MASE3 domain-containing protein [Thermoanaerobaculia bacterium]